MKCFICGEELEESCKILLCEKCIAAIQFFAATTEK